MKQINTQSHGNKVKGTLTDLLVDKISNTL